MDDKVYAITDLNGYISEIRIAAAQSLSDNSDNDNLDDYISLNEMIGIVKQHSIGMDNENRYLLNEGANEKIFDETAAWIHNIGLSKLAGQDLLECAWDSDLNEMVFWAKPSEKKSNVRKKPRRKNMGDQK